MKCKLSIIIIFSLCLRLLASQEFKTIQSTNSFLEVEYKPDYSLSTISINNEKYTKVNLLYGSVENQDDFGAPQILTGSMLVGVPAEFGNTIQVITAEYDDIKGKLTPVPSIESKNELLSYNYKINEKYKSFSSELVSFGEFGIARGLPVQSIKIFPVQFDLAGNNIRIYKKIRFRINFTSSKSVSNIVTDDLISEAIINYSQAKVWTKVKEISLQKTNASGVLSTGKWWRFEAPEEGIYKITKSFLASLSADFNSVDPRTIKIYNNGGKVLPENILTSRPGDLQENAIYIEGESDGKLDDNDYIIFYGRGIHFWEYDKTTKKMVRYYHPYSKENYYWITLGGNTGKRMNVVQSLNTTADNIQNTSAAYFCWEEDKAKLMPSGRYYMGDEMTESMKTRIYRNYLYGIIPGSAINYKFNVVNRAELSSGLKIYESGNLLKSFSLGGLGIGQLDEAQSYRGLSYNYETSFSGSIANEQSEMKFVYEPNSSPSISYINYFEIYYNKNLKAANGELLFYCDRKNGVTEYRLTDFPSSDIKIFNVNDFSNVNIISTSEISGGQCTFRVMQTDSIQTKYFALASSAYKGPKNFTLIENSNLRGISEGAKYIIISPKDFLVQAEAYKTFKETNSRTKLSSIVVDVADIFNEFSGGLTDVSGIRDFIKYCYDTWSIKPEYVLFFGDGDYDFKNVEGKNENFIIPYESIDSYHNIYSYCSDDFYTYVDGNDIIVDIALGRLNVKSASEAEEMVNKIIRYESSSELGIWKNLVTLVADDGPAKRGDDDGNLHTRQSEDLSKNVLPKSFDQAKIYLTTYPTVQTAIGRRKPEVNKAIVNAINDGTLMLNWVGHGNPEVWAHEYVFEKSTSIPQMINDKYFFLTAATCDFGRYDVPGTQSSTELMLLKNDGGSIGIFTAARTVYSENNHAINVKFYKSLLTTDSLNQINSLGKAYMLTKMQYYDTNSLKFHLFGDPTLRLQVPAKPVTIDSINGKSASTSVQIAALSKVKINGTIRDMNGNTINSSDGEVIVSVFDSERTVELPEMSYSMVVQGGVIFKGRSSVENGKFSTEFTVPKDITYENKAGKIVIYFSNSAEDGVGYTSNITVNGTDSTATSEKNGPEINITLDNPEDKDGYLVNPDFTLYVKLNDETGLNTTGNGIGHTLEGILNNNESEPIDLTNYFIGDLNAGGKSGSVIYKFNGLDNGEYNIQIKAWDVFNNYSTDNKNFIVVNGSDLLLRDVVNYPNPFSNYTTFTFQHNLTQAINIKIKVYTVAGRLIKELEDSNISDKFVKVDWDGKDADGNSLANGVYLYKLIVKTLDEKFNKEFLGKLAIVR